MSSHQPPADWTPDTAQSALKEVCAKAGTDAAFRELCLKSPADAIAEITGRALPSGFSVRFVDNQKADLTVVLPDLAANTELSDQDLEAVSGGLKCFIGSCGATEVCGITDACLSSKGEDNPAGKKTTR